MHARNQTVRARCMLLWRPKISALKCAGYSIGSGAVPYGIDGHASYSTAHKSTSPQRDTSRASPMLTAAHSDSSVKSAGHPCREHIKGDYFLSPVGKLPAYSTDACHFQLNRRYPGQQDCTGATKRLKQCVCNVHANTLSTGVHAT